MTSNPNYCCAPNVQIRYIDPAKVVDTGLIARMHAWLDVTEKARLERYKQAEHRHAFLISHALTRQVLAKSIGCEPADICFEGVGRGKPVLAKPMCNKPVHFNLAHTTGLAVLALSPEPVGVDVEWLKRKTAGIELASRYFTSAEQADIASQPADLQQQRFLLYWTLKEAFLKAQAWGIVDRLSGFEFELSPSKLYPPDRIRLRVRDAKLTPTHPWRFHHWQLPSAHLISLAISARLDPQTTVDIRAWSEEEWDWG